MCFGHSDYLLHYLIKLVVLIIFVKQTFIMGLNKYSRQVTQDSTQPAAQAMLHAIGLTDDDFKKPLVGIASTGYEGNPCNMHLNDLSVHVKKGIENDKKMVGLIFNTIGVSDGISMGTPGMRFSLPLGML